MSRPGGVWVALDPDPDPDGSFLLGADGVSAVELPVERFRATSPAERRADPLRLRVRRAHNASCVAPGLTSVGGSIARLARGDTRGTRRAGAPMSATIPQWGQPAVIRPVSACDACGQPIVWGISVLDGGGVPLDPEPHRVGMLAFFSNADPADARVVPVSVGANAQPRYVLHHLTCHATPNQQFEAATRRR